MPPLLALGSVYGSLSCQSPVSPPCSQFFSVLIRLTHLPSQITIDLTPSFLSLKFKKGLLPCKEMQCCVHMCVCVCVCVPDCSGAEGGRGAGGDVGVVLGVQLIVNSILQGHKKNKTDCCQRYRPPLTHTQTHFNRGFTVASRLLATLCGSIVEVHWRIGFAQIRG